MSVEQNRNDLCGCGSRWKYKDCCGSKRHSAQVVTQSEMIATEQPTHSVETLVGATLNELDRLGESHSCIFAGAVLTETLRTCGYPTAYLLTVEAKIYNAALVRQIEKHGATAIQATRKGMSEDPESVGIIIGSRDLSSTVTDWSGHLTVIVPKHDGTRDLVCDLTLPQANSTENNIILPPIISYIANHFLTDSEPFRFIRNGCWVMYKTFPKDNSYKNSAIWQNKSYQNLAVQHILASLERAA